MIKRFNERKVDIKENLKSGIGALEFREVASKEELFNKVKMFTTITIKKGESIGYHTHNGEEEVMIINSGIGTYKDDGKEYEVKPGDVTICFEGHYHSIENKQEENLVLTGFIIEK